MLDINHKFWNKKYEYLYKYLGEKIYSEHQEDGIVEAFFKKNKPKYKYFVDVGAYGQLSSNTWALLDKGWQGLMVDSNKTQIEEIAQFASNNKFKYRFKQITIDNLTELLLEEGVPLDFDFLSIDVDSIEYEIWKNLTVFKPKLICIEVNQQEPDFNVIDYDPSFSLWKFKDKSNGYGGATIGLMNKLADEKGYDYLCWDVSNAFYIRRD